ncbi:hypothetical protein [Radicibacter daui]|uniref:hypothetical protein n=1 Tax=Radicibacter daui TaxID=3064829 RepID=UPI004046AD4B
MAIRRSLQLVLCLALGLAVTAGCWGAIVFEERAHVLGAAQERVNGLARLLEQQLARAALPLSALRALIVMRNGWVSEEIFVSYIRALAITNPAVEGLELAPDAFLDFATARDGSPADGSGDLLAQTPNRGLLLEAIRNRQFLVSDTTELDGTRRLTLREAVFLPGRASRLDIPDFYGLVGVRLSFQGLMQHSGIDPARHLLAQPGAGDTLYRLYGDSGIPAGTTVQSDLVFHGHAWRLYERVDPTLWWFSAEALLATVAGFVGTAALAVGFWLTQRSGRRAQYMANEMETVLGLTGTGWMLLFPSGTLSLSSAAAQFLSLPSHSSAQGLLAAVDGTEVMMLQRFLLETGSGGTSQLTVSLRPDKQGVVRRFRLLAGPQDADRRTLIVLQRMED